MKFNKSALRVFSCYIFYKLNRAYLNRVQIKTNLLLTAYIIFTVKLSYFTKFANNGLYLIKSILN